MAMLFKRRNIDAGLHGLVFELNKICNGAVYTDVQHLNRLILQFLRGVADYNAVMGIQKMPWHERAGFHGHARSARSTRSTHRQGQCSGGTTVMSIFGVAK